MTAAEKQTVDMLLELVKANAKSNDDAHQDIIERITGLATGFTDSHKEFRLHCAERERVVNAAIKDLADRPTKFEVSVKTIGKFSAAVLGNAAVIFGALAAFGVIG